MGFTILLMISSVGYSLVVGQYKFDHKVNLPSSRPYIIAHRGSSGILPEHTIQAYQTAIDQGADVIECDATITKDLHIVCLHDLSLGGNTNVAQLAEFNQSTHNLTLGDGHHVVLKNWFSFDYTLQELKKLRKVQTSPFRDPRYNGMYTIPSIEEFLGVASDAKRKVGVHIETKMPETTNKLPIMNGTTIEELLVNVLKTHGYTDKTDPCFIQSFSFDSLLRIKKLSRLSLVYLTPKELTPSDEDLRNWSSLFYGIGPWKNAIVKTYVNGSYKNPILQKTDLVTRAHNVGLKVHAYTFRNEDRYLSWDYAQNAYTEYDIFFNTSLDGYFTDFPGTMYDYLNKKYPTRCSENDVSQAVSNYFNIFLTIMCVLVAL